ncbi:MAG: hypothetical protein IH905_00605 [Proteobacteria bacterium]|nr:hypothetical protein [Pseudomonadota bacterium]
MSSTLLDFETPDQIHSWLRQTSVALVPGPRTPLLDEFCGELSREFRRHGHDVSDEPSGATDAIFTTARFGEPVTWRDAPIFTMRKQYGLDHTPTVFTFVHITPSELQKMCDHFAAAAKKPEIDPADYEFEGLAQNAASVLHEQGRRAGPILALARLVQAQATSIRSILVVGEDHPTDAYHFDLVGGYPRTRFDDKATFYEDIVLRIVTAITTTEITHHEVEGDLIPVALWRALSTPRAMKKAGREFRDRDFFSDVVHVNAIVQVPRGVGDVVANQYSEGCFTTWEPELDALIATVTGSARAVDKGNINDRDLAVITGVRPDGQGALVRHIAERTNIPPSSEAVEMVEIDQPLPTVEAPDPLLKGVMVPVVRSKLHGHRGVRAFDPDQVEYAPLDPRYHRYLVTCATEAQAEGVRRAFARSEALQNPDDPRQVVFTVLPGHGIMIVEKWVAGMTPFQMIWEYMDAGYLEIESGVPQGALEYIRSAGGRMLLQTE